MRMRISRLLAGLLHGTLLVSGGMATQAGAQTVQPSEWTWTGGSSTAPPSECCGAPGWPGVYGNLGVPAPGNIPGSRTNAVTWTDSKGDLWLFGGQIEDPRIDEGAHFGFLNDLWEFNPSTNQWTWMAGSNAVTLHNTNYVEPYCGQPGVYGTLGVPAPGNTPGGRSGAIGWTDYSGNFWLFGGQGLDVTSNLGLLNDLWEFNPSTNEWAWMGGSNTVPVTVPPSIFNAPNGVYGTLGTPAPGNTPGGRAFATSWTDSAGRLWLFGGEGVDRSQTYTAILNDLWQYDPATAEWAWMSGSNAVTPVTIYGMPGVYGTLGMPAPANTPGNRIESMSWTDNAGNLWLYGGLGAAPDNTWTDYSDLWEFSPFTGQWAWMGGSNQNLTLPGVYGTLGMPSAGNTPGGRDSASTWVDSNGNPWLFGGNRDGAPGFANSSFNDLWEFDSSSKEWTWMGGTGKGGSPGAYGVLGTPDPANIPGSRSSALQWTGADGRFWLFGGAGLDTNGNTAILNDFWSFNPPTGLPPAARPAFSEEDGTYTSTQTIHISDSTPGATIYYTTDGVSIPTTSSAAYTGPIPVSSTMTLIAVAAAPGFSNSPVASAVYTIKLPPDFSLATSPGSMTVSGGQSGRATISVNPANAFNATVTFACSGLPSGALCSFSPASVTPSGGAASTTLTIATTASAAMHRRTSPLSSGLVLAAILCCVGWKSRRRFALVVMFAVAALALGALNACGGGSGTSTSTSQPTTSIITVTATAGVLQHSTTISLTVN